MTEEIMDIQVTEEMVERLKKEWFERFDLVLDVHKTVPLSGLKCLELCQAGCCPHAAMRAMEPSEIPSTVVVLLPFEMEYLIAILGISPDIFRRWPLELAPGVTIAIGILDLGKPCPFLSEALHCKIHFHKPLDCRTYPLLPFRDARGNLDWQLGENCPSLDSLTPTFVEAIKHIWRDLYPSIPQSWWDLYAFADHWTGWPDPAEGRDAS